MSRGVERGSLTVRWEWLLLVAETPFLKVPS